jgi:hypothetical protein
MKKEATHIILSEILRRHYSISKVRRLEAKERDVKERMD